MYSDREKIIGHTHDDPSQQPKSEYVDTIVKYSKIEQENHRKDFLKQWEECSKKDSTQSNIWRGK